MSDKRCIFYYPWPISDDPTSGSQLRPKMMLEAFKRIGYRVDDISGYGRERKEKVNIVKRNINNGVVYDFLYSESLSQPTLLAEKDHIPRHPFFDFHFFKFCKKSHIPIGLFYRDMYWKFEIYKNTVPWFKRMITIPLHQYDLRMYHKLIDILFVPTEKLKDYGLKHFMMYELPPGCKINIEICEHKKRGDRDINRLNLLYIGGVSGVYDPYNIIKAAAECENVFLIICTPEEHWNTHKKTYIDILNESITIIHKKSSELQEYYKNADIALACQAPNEYMNMASPIKAKETIGYGTPIIVSSNMALSEKVVKGNYGWKVNADVEDIKKLLIHLLKNPEEIREKTIGAIEAGKKNTWECRAEQVASILRKCGEQ